jgi:hypothetical protein
MMHAQFVTVPILDARLQELRAETRISLMELKSDILHSRVELEAKIDRRYGELETTIERTKAELIRWVSPVKLGNVALTAGATAV